jgi:hypothetical protein
VCAPVCARVLGRAGEEVEGEGAEGGKGAGGDGREVREKEGGGDLDDLMGLRKATYLPRQLCHLVLHLVYLSVCESACVRACVRVCEWAGSLT